MYLEMPLQFALGMLSSNSFDIFQGIFATGSLNIILGNINTAKTRVQSGIATVLAPIPATNWREYLIQTITNHLLLEALNPFLSLCLVVAFADRRN